jgi:hypothetical protein
MINSPFQGCIDISPYNFKTGPLLLTYGYAWLKELTLGKPLQALLYVKYTLLVIVS